MWSNFDEVIKIQILIKEQIFCLPMEFNYQLPLYDQKNLHEDNLLVEHWYLKYVLNVNKGHSF